MLKKKNNNGKTGFNDKMASKCVDPPKTGVAMTLFFCSALLTVRDYIY